MTERRRANPPVNAARLAVAGVIIAGGALAMAGQAGADPEVPYPTPVPAAAPAPGQPVLEPSAAALGALPPPPVGTPTVPEIQNPVYGSGQSGSGPLSSLRDIWHQAQDPYSVMGSPDQMPMAAPPPPGAGPAPQLPPGYLSTNAPESNGPPATASYAGGALPPGYYPLTGPPPPGYFDPPTSTGQIAPGLDPSAQVPATPVPPTP